MIEDGLPAALAMTAEQRRAARNLDAALTTMPAETVNRLAPTETEAMKKLRATAAKSATKKAIHVPKKPKKTVAKTKNLGARTAVAKAVERLTKPAKPPAAPKKVGKPANPATRVSGQAIGEATCVAGGVAMAELVKMFGIEAHPMRAKIYYAKHQLGYVIENREGRYHGTRPVPK